MINPSITTEVEQLLLGKNFASFATLMKDGSPHVAPTWVDYDGDMVLINTAAGRIKEKNVNSDKRVALSVYDSSNPYNMVTIRGKIKVPTLEGIEEIQINPRSQPNSVVILKDKGLPSKKRRGNQYVRVLVDLPVKITAKQKELLEQFRDSQKS